MYQNLEGKLTAKREKDGDVCGGTWANMNIQSIPIELTDETASESVSAVVATLLAVRGSAFRKPGARLTIWRDGRRHGALSAGCVETDLVERSASVFATGRPIIAVIRTGGDDEIYFGTGTGCDGELTVLLEPRVEHATTHDADAPVDRIRHLTATLAWAGPEGVSIARAEKRADSPAFAVADNSESRTLCAYLDDHPTAYGNIDDRVLAALFPSLVRPICLVEQVEPAPRAMVFGAGPVAAALCPLLAGVGWSVVGIDRRPLLGTAEGFPSAEVHCAPYEAALDIAAPDAWTHAVLLTHNLLDDAELLRAYLDSPVASITIMSSRKRLERLYEQLAGDGRPVTDSDRARIHGPAGLDIGAHTPEEIALAIAAELVASSRGRSGLPLRDVRKASSDCGGTT